MDGKKPTQKNKHILARMTDFNLKVIEQLDKGGNILILVSIVMGLLFIFEVIVSYI